MARLGDQLGITNVKEGNLDHPEATVFCFEQNEVEANNNTAAAHSAGSQMCVARILLHAFHSCLRLHPKCLENVIFVHVPVTFHKFCHLPGMPFFPCLSMNDLFKLPVSVQISQ